VRTSASRPIEKTGTSERRANSRSDLERRRAGGVDAVAHDHDRLAVRRTRGDAPDRLRGGVVEGRRPCRGQLVEHAAQQRAVRREVLE
jgi:hypothetical protein